MPKYAAHIFDCDGVLLDSNHTKEDAFYRAALPYGEARARALVDYHRQAGATGRSDRVNYFFKSIVMAHVTHQEKEQFLEQVSSEVVKGLRECPLVPGVEEYLGSLRGPLYVVSGVEESELVALLKHHRLLGFFDDVVGTNDKLKTLYNLVMSKTIDLPAVYYGDTEDDLRCARSAGLEFVLIYGSQSPNSPIRASRSFEELL